METLNKLTSTLLRIVFFTGMAVLLTLFCVLLIPLFLLFVLTVAWFLLSCPFEDIKKITKFVEEID